MKNNLFRRNHSSLSHFLDRRIEGLHRSPPGLTMLRKRRRKPRPLRRSEITVRHRGLFVRGRCVIQGTTRHAGLDQLRLRVGCTEPTRGRRPTPGTGYRTRSGAPGPRASGRKDGPPTQRLHRLEDHRSHEVANDGDRSLRFGLVAKPPLARDRRQPTCGPDPRGGHGWCLEKGAPLVHRNP